MVELSEELQRFISGASSSHSDADARLAQLDAELVLERGNIAKLRDQLREKVVRVKQLEGEKGKFKEAKDAADAEIVGLKAALDKKSEALRRALKDRADLELMVEHWKIQAIRLEELLRSSLALSDHKRSA